MNISSMSKTPTIWNWTLSKIYIMQIRSYKQDYVGFIYSFLFPFPKKRLKNSLRIGRIQPTKLNEMGKNNGM